MGSRRRNFLVAGNWKMNGSLAGVQALAAANADGAMARLNLVQLVLFPPFLYLPEAQRCLGDSGMAWGAQNVSEHESGAYTGEVSAQMLREFGCACVLVGHSERRTDHKERDADVRAKAEAAWRAGLTAIVCVGETRAERDGGRALAVVAEQLAGSIPDGADGARLIVAYEPVWSIGTGLTPTVADVAEMHAAIRRVLTTRFGSAAADLRLLYGGSVKPGNAAELLAVPNVDGALVGGASLKADDFLGIARGAPTRA